MFGKKETDKVSLMESDAIGVEATLEHSPTISTPAVLASRWGEWFTSNLPAPEISHPTSQVSSTNGSGWDPANRNPTLQSQTKLQNETPKSAASVSPEDTKSRIHTCWNRCLKIVGVIFTVLLVLSASTRLVSIRFLLEHEKLGESYEAVKTMDQGLGQYEEEFRPEIYEAPSPSTADKNKDLLELSNDLDEMIHVLHSLDDLDNSTDSQELTDNYESDDTRRRQVENNSTFERTLFPWEE